MTDRAGRMQRVARLSESAEQRERRALGTVVEQLARERARLGELERYRTEYRGRNTADQRFAGAQWRDYQQFLARLDQAIDIQARVVADCERRCEARRKAWAARRRECDSLERVVDRLREQAALERERRDQGSEDEAATAMVLRGARGAS